MAWATRLTDRCTSETPSITGSPNVFTNGLNQMRCSDIYSCLGILIEGSSTVFVNNLPAGREGDKTNHGCVAMDHSPDVNICGGKKGC